MGNIFDYESQNEFWYMKEQNYYHVNEGKLYLYDGTITAPIIRKEYISIIHNMRRYIIYKFQHIFIAKIFIINVIFLRKSFLKNYGDSSLELRDIFSSII